MLTVIIVLALAVSGYFLYKKYKTSNNSEEILVKEVLKNILERFIFLKNSNKTKLHNKSNILKTLLANI